MDAHGSSVVRPLRRRNGRPQACEPCRQRKVACDHHYPVCARCRRGNIPQKCVYIVQGPVAVRETPLSPVRGSSGSARSTPVSTEATPSLARADAPTVAGPDRDAGFLGATSFSAMFTETRNSLSLLQGPGGVLGADGLATEDGLRPLLDAAPVQHSSSLDRELETLRAIPTKEQCDMLRTQDEAVSTCWSRLALFKLHESLWDTFGRHLDEPRDLNDLKEMGQLLSRNSSSPLAEDQADPDDWFQAFSGTNMRWESLGVLFTFWANSVMALSNDTTGKRPNKVFEDGKRDLMMKYKNAVSNCRELCRPSGNRNSLFVYMSYKYSLIQSMISGDASWEFWRLHAEVATFTTFLGFHEAAKPSAPDRSIATQIKRRVFCSIFVTDKLVAAFNGRPPVLSRNYLAVALPLDISEEMFLSKDFADPNLDLRVDENGWNIDNNLYLTTTLRARALLGFVRDAILEIALPDTVAEEHVLFNLLQREMQIVSQFPSVLLLQDGDIKSHSLDATTLFVRLLVRLEHLQNLFFIERLVSKQKSAVSPQLLELSLEMVTLTLAFWTHQDRLNARSADFEFLVMSYAAPAGGILCTELLNPSSSRGSGKPPVTRSNIIQQLSLLFGFLDWVGPAAPNVDLCGHVKQVIKRVLDEALNVSPDAPGLMGEVGNWDMGFSGDLNEYFSFDLLDTFDWLRPERG